MSNKNIKDFYTLKDSVLDILYTRPQQQLKIAIQKFTRAAVRYATGQQNLRPSYFVFRGKNYYTHDGMYSWEMEEIKFPTEMHDELYGLLIMEQELEDETIWINNYLRELFNHCERFDDIRLLLDETVMNELKWTPSIDRDVSIMTVHYSKIASRHIAEGNRILRERVIANMLIRSL